MTSLVPSNGGSLSGSGGGSLVEKVLALRSAFADRRELDASIAALDRQDWGDWTSVPSPAKSVKAIASGHSSSSGGGRSRGRAVKTMPINRSDLSVTPPTTRIPSTVPRQITNVMFWDVINVRQSPALVAGFNETNYAFSLTSHPKSATLAGIFDQWCIPLVSITWYNTQAPGSTSGLPELHTALDFDNTTALGSLQLIDDYDTVAVCSMSPGRRFTRSVKPANSTAVNGGNGLIRIWCDVATPGAAWNGIRSAIQSSGALAAGTVAVEYTVWYCFRGRR